MTKPRLLYAVTHPTTAKHLLRGQLAFMRENGFDVVVLSSPGPELELVREREGVSTVAVPMSRALQLREGPRAMTKMLAAVRAARPDVINASTPKLASTFCEGFVSRASRAPFSRRSEFQSASPLRVRIASCALARAFAASMWPVDMRQSARRPSSHRMASISRASPHMINHESQPQEYALSSASATVTSWLGSLGVWSLTRESPI